MKVKLLTPHDHSEGTLGFKSSNTRHHWWYLNGEMDWQRDRLGRRNPKGSRCWAVVVCALSDKCPARAIVDRGLLEDDIARNIKEVQNERL